MATIDHRVYGLKGVIDLVKVLMTREERNGALRSRHVPVLVVEGFRGSGKSALVTALADLLDQSIPHARLDLDTNRHATVPQLLSAIAFDLSRKRPRYDSLGFPRFIVGQLAMSLELDLRDHEKARHQVVDALKRHRGFDTVRGVLAETAGEVLATVGPSGVPVPPTRLLDSMIEWLADRSVSRRLVLGAFQDWYGHRDLGLLHDPIDVLVDLNRWASDYGDDDTRQRIDDLLWSAFLADLRAEFGKGRQADERSVNCVVLLDNVDTELGRRFLHQLVRARRQRVAGDEEDADPLTVVATSRGALLSDVADGVETVAREELPRFGAGGSIAESPQRWWLRYRLPDLTEDEVARTVTDMAMDWGDNQCLSRVVHQLTGGHSAATRLLVDAAATAAPSRWFAPESMLERDEPGHFAESVPTVEQRLLERLLGEVSDVALRDLVTCSAARQRQHALALAGQQDLLVSGLTGYEEVLDPILWPAEESAGRTLLHRLLRRRLAARGGESDLPSWSGVHARLRVLCRAEGDETGDLYYALADDELGYVTRQLYDRLLELHSEVWFELLEAVTLAPSQHRHTEAPIDEVRAGLDEAEPDEPLVCVARLVAALRIAADPFTDSRRRDLHLQIADDFSAVSRLCPDGPHTVFLEATRRHRREAEWWD